MIAQVRGGHLSESDRQIIDVERMEAGFEELESGMRDALNKLSYISKSIENEFSERRHQREGNIPGNSDNIKALSHIIDQKRRDILAWLSPLDFGTVQKNTLTIYLKIWVINF